MKLAGNKKERQAGSLPALLLLLIILVPCGIILSSLMEPGGELWKHIQRTLLPSYIKDTLILVFAVLGLTLITGVGTAYFVSRYEFPLRRFLNFGLILPMAIPGYVAAIVYAGVVDYTGPIQSFLRNYMGIEAGTWKIFDIMNLPGAVFIISITLYPYIYVPVKNAMNTYALSYIEPSLALGKRNWFFKILIPVSLPAITGGAALVLMEVLNDYGVVSYFGVQVFQTGIFRAWFSLGDLGASMKLSSFLLLFAVLIIAGEKLFYRNKRFSFTNRVMRPAKRIRATGAKRVFIFLFCFTPFLLGFLIPLIQLTAWLTDSFTKVVNREFFELTMNSFFIAGAAVVTALIFSSMAALLNNRNLPGWIKKPFALISVGYAIPGTVIAVGIMVLFGAVDRFIPGLVLSGSFFALIYAYNIRFMAVAFRPLNAGFTAVSSRYKEASRSLGVSRTRTLFCVELALLKKSFMVSAILLFVDLLKELPLTMILRPFNFDTLATKIYELAGDEQIPESAAPAMILILTGLLPIYILNRLSEKKNGTKTD